MKRYYSKSQLKQKQLLPNLILWLIALCSSGVNAIEESTGFALEEIIVTARKTEENLQEVPISVTAFSSTDIEARRLADLEDIALNVPNVNFSRNLGNAIVSIRGIADEDLIVTSDPLVGVYIDGVYISRLQGGFFEMLDVERIEVLKGPQGTLFGKNTVGGAISITSKRPQGDGSGYLKAGGGEDAHFNFQGSYDFGLTDDLSLKLSGLYKRRDCLVERESDNGCLDDEDLKVFRAYANYQPNDDFRAALIVDGSWDDGHAQVLGVTVVEPSGLFTTLFYDLDRAADPTLPPYAPVGLDDPSVTDGNGPTDDEITSYGVSLQLEWALKDNLTVRSTSSYKDHDSIARIEFDNFSETIFQNDGFATLSETFSQELIFEGSGDRLNWLAGFYYFYEDAENESNLRVADSFLTGGINQFISSKVNSISGFGHVTYSLTDRLNLSAGVRYTSEKREFNAFGDLSGLPPGNGLFQSGFDDSDTWTAWSPKGSLDFKLTEDVMVYASVAKGFRSGGFNGQTNTTDPVFNSYDPEKMTNYEIGLKGAWGQRVIFNTAVYYLDYKDRQFSFQLAQASGSVPIAVRGNAAEAELIGVETELKVVLTDKLKLEAGFAYNDHEYTDLRDDALGLRISLDSPFQYAPKTTANLALQYTEPDFAGFGEATFRVDSAYKSRIYFNTVPAEINDPLLGPSNYQDGYAKVNAQITLAPHNSNWTLALYGRNLTDKIIEEFNLGIPGTGFDRASYGQPREIGGEVRYDF